MEEKKPDVFERAWLFLANATCENAGVAAVGLRVSDRKEGEPCFQYYNRQDETSKCT